MVSIYASFFFNGIQFCDSYLKFLHAPRLLKQKMHLCFLLLFLWFNFFFPLVHLDLWYIEFGCQEEIFSYYQAIPEDIVECAKRCRLFFWLLGKQTPFFLMIAFYCEFKWLQ